MIKVIIWGIISIIVSVVLSQTIPISTTAKRTVKVYEALEIFEQIHDIARQRELMLYRSEITHNKKWGKVFYQTENNYHIAQDIHKKFEKAKELNILINEQDIYLHQTENIEPERDERFHQLENRLNNSQAN